MTAHREECARRRDRLQWAAATRDPLPFDADAARMCGRIFAATRPAGRSARPRPADPLITSGAAASGVPLPLRSPAGFAGFEYPVAIKPL